MKTPNKEQDFGLTSKEAEEHLRESGPNVIPEESVNASLLFLKKFWGVIPWMLEAAIILDMILGRFAEAVIIGALLLFQAVMGFRKEKNAKDALALLRKRLSITARVKRDGKWQIIPAASLTIGDLVHLRVGDIVPADITISTGLVSADQSQLTGESLPIDKKAKDTLYSGSIIRHGEASGIVSAIGEKTYFGKTAHLMKTAQAPRRLQLLIIQIAKYLGALDIALIAVLIVISFFQTTPLLNLLTFSLMLLVISVPVMLPPMFTMSVAIGASKLAQKGILATRLSAIEDLATMDVLCMDKTGTITKNKLSLEQVEPLSKIPIDKVLRLAAFVSDKKTQDPIDLAIIEAADKQNLLENVPQRLNFKPFDPSTKRSEAEVMENNKKIKIVKGSPVILAKLTHTPWVDVSDKVNKLSSTGARVVAVASSSPKKLNLIGLIALSDPPREDAAQLINELNNQGVKILLLTGDGEVTAKAIAAKVGIPVNVAPQGTIHENLDYNKNSQFNIFPNIFPQEKNLLVHALQKAGHVVGMIGDGVNDAQALTQSDVGIATANAMDVAKSAAGLVLTKNSLAEILMGVKISRKIYQRMQTWVLAMVSRKASIPPFLAIALVLLGAFALNPLLIVLFMLFGDVATFALSTDTTIPSAEPNRWIVRSLVIAGSGIAVFFFLFSFAIFWFCKDIANITIGSIQTIIFIWMVFVGAQVILYLTRAINRPFWSRPFPSKTLLLVSFFDIILALILAKMGWLMDPIPFLYIGIIAVLSLVFLVLGDVIKLITFKITRHYVD